MVSYTYAFLLFFRHTLNCSVSSYGLMGGATTEGLTIPDKIIKYEDNKYIFYSNSLFIKIDQYKNLVLYNT
jgi:hypothetical protein